MILLALLLAACGGGGSSQTGPIIPAPPIRGDLLFGYYGSCDPLENADHTNLCWEGGWRGINQTLANLKAAQGKAIVLEVPTYASEDDVRAYLMRIRDAGLLTNISALYPIDEPDVNGKSDAEVLVANAKLRLVMAEFPELKDTKLAVIYGNTGRFPGIASYDWVGRDQYGLGCHEATGAGFREMKARLLPTQRLMLIPGGADPWRQDPACFEAAAHGDEQVVAIVPFIWPDFPAVGVGAGIRSNGLRKLYCDAGRKIMGLAACV